MTDTNLKVVEEEKQEQSRLTIAPVPLTMIDFMYPKCIPHLQKVVDRAPNEISIESIKRNLMIGKQMLVVITEGEEIIACNVVEQVTFDTGYRVLYIPITGGARMDEWEDRFLMLAKAIARDLNCQEMRGLACRKGWLKNLEPRGWYRIHEVVGCKVEPEETEK